MQCWAQLSICLRACASAAVHFVFSCMWRGAGSVGGEPSLLSAAGFRWYIVCFHRRFSSLYGSPRLQ